MYCNTRYPVYRLALDGLAIYFERCGVGAPVGVSDVGCLFYLVGSVGSVQFLCLRLQSPLGTIRVLLPMRC